MFRKAIGKQRVMESRNWGNQKITGNG